MKQNIQFDGLSKTIIGCAIEVHRELGPGLLESAYEQCLAHELRLKGIPFELQKVMPVKYKGNLIDCGYRLDLLVDSRIVVELKSVAALEPIHEAQILTYLKLAKVRTGLLINFNVPLLKDGLKRFVV
jgi:GxxExxY protein